MHYTAKNNVPLEIILPREDKENVSKIQSTIDYTCTLFSNVSSKNSTCYILNDQDRIHELIEASAVSFRQMDNLIHDRLKDALQIENSELNKEIKDRIRFHSKDSNQKLLIEESVASVTKMMRDEFIPPQSTTLVDPNPVQQLIERTVDDINSIIVAKFQITLDEISKIC